MRRLDFSPARHGFHFRNLFVNHPVPFITTYGLCGGMALAAARYWQHGIPIPTHVEADFPDGSPAGTPPQGSALQQYIFGCQLSSYGPANIASAASWLTPGATLDNQFQWSVSEFEAIRRSIDAGKPTVVGLRRVVGGPLGHQVLAYGYDERNRSVFVYDSNFPDQEKTLRLDMGTRTIAYDGNGSPQWSSFFVTNCPMEGARPEYVDLGVAVGLKVTPVEPVPAGSRVAVDVVVANFGFRDAHVRELYVYVRGPHGENLDAMLDGGDNDPRPIPAGASREIQRAAASFGGAPGMYTIGVSYLSQQDQWVSLPAINNGTRNEVTVKVVEGSVPVVSKSKDRFAELIK